jgi:hypothetical protein
MSESLPGNKKQEYLYGEQLILFDLFTMSAISREGL